MDANEKHLEFLQAVIARMASNSFLLKGWSVTLVSALLALEAGTGARNLAVVSFFPAFVFFVLDGYFLHMERRFRALYDEVREGRERSPYRMALPSESLSSELRGWGAALLSRSVAWIHIVILGAIVLAIVWL